MGRFVRTAALCWAVEVAVAKVITVSEGLCSTDLPAPTYGWVSTNGTISQYTFPPRSVPSPSASVPDVYPTPSVSVPVVTGTVTPIPDTSVSVPSSYVVPPASYSSPIIDPIYTDSSVPPVSLPSPISSSSEEVPPVSLPSVIPSVSDTAVVPPASSPIVTSALPSDTPTSTTTSIFSYITPNSSDTPISAPTPSSSDAPCVQTAPQGATIQCPVANDLTFCQGNINWGLKCGIKYDLISMSDIIFTYNPEECLDFCLQTPGCGAINWSTLTSDCTLAYGIFGVMAEVSPYDYFMYNRYNIDDGFIPTNVCPFGGCTEMPTDGSV